MMMAAASAETERKAAVCSMSMVWKISNDDDGVGAGALLFGSVGRKIGSLVLDGGGGDDDEHTNTREGDASRRPARGGSRWCRQQAVKRRDDL